MLDFRFQTFLTLCELNNYTHTAEYLHITQPAVTQHIQYLEKYYAAPLFIHQGKNLILTPEGELLKRYAAKARAEEQKLAYRLSSGHLQTVNLNFGATLSIGEFIMPSLLAQYNKINPSAHISMVVENTQSLLHKLDMGLIEFAVIEGEFNRKDYACTLFSREPFLAVCSPSYPLPSPPLTIDKLTAYPVITRESGSGTRNILENALHAHHYSLDDFTNTLEIGNFKAIKYLAERQCGISFLYKPVVKEELASHKLKIITILDFSFFGEFNFVYLKNSSFSEAYEQFFQFCKSNNESEEKPL